VYSNKWRELVFWLCELRAPSFHVTSLNFFEGGDLSAYFRNENIIHHGCEDVDDDVLSEGVCHFLVKAHKMKIGGIHMRRGLRECKEISKRR